MTRKNNIEIMTYFRQIKRRLNGSFYDYYRNKYLGQPEKGFYLDGKPMSVDELRVIESVVNFIMAREDFICNPLARLIVNKEEFRAFDEERKQRYLLDLSKIYIYFTEKWKKERNLE